jgi:hypothetical protein
MYAEELPPATPIEAGKPPSAAMLLSALPPFALFLALGLALGLVGLALGLALVLVLVRCTVVAVWSDGESK